MPSKPQLITIKFVSSQTYIQSLIIFIIFYRADFGTDGLSAGAVVGIVAAVALAVILLLGILWWRGCLRRKETMDEGTLSLTILNK